MTETKIPIAVVDDDPRFVRALERLLRAAGFAPLRYDSAESFLRDVPHPRMDCLLLDVRLGTMSGFDVARRITEEGSRVPILFMTAHDSAETREQARQAGAAGYLPKPFPAEALFEAIQAAMPGNAMVAEAALAAWATARGVQGLGTTAPQKPED